MSKIHLTFVFFLFANIILAQETYTTSGGNATGTTGNSSYTIGQTFYSVKTGTDQNYIIEGVQQSYEITSLINLPDTKDINPILYPNPTTDYLIIEIEKNDNNKLAYQLWDINGRLLSSEKIISQETIINTNQLNSSTYFVKITDNNKIIKAFKIIKH